MFIKDRDMKIVNKYSLLVALALPVMSLTSCNEDWDSHYERSETVSNETVYQLIKEDPTLEKFGKMIDLAGYAEVLNSSQTFTVWAPTSEALKNVDLENLDEVKRLVGNHISRFNVSTATPSNKGVRMYNGKVHYFDGATFGGVALETSDVVAKNGVLHTLKAMIPYAYNLREYIDTHENTSMIAAFLKRYDEKVFDEQASTPLDVDENGATIYDSVMTSYNRLFQHPVYGLGDIEAEDSVFTMIIPDNLAWQEAYDKISRYFNVYNADATVADSIKEVQTSLAIINDLIYRQRIENPAGLSMVESTSHSEISDVAGLFNGAECIDASNGMIYLAPSINYNNVETWNKPIEVEAEDQIGRSPSVGSTIYTRTVATSNPYYSEISESRYIEVKPNAASRQPGVTFSIPNVLSGEYRIYVSFVPTSVDDITLATDSTRVQFTLSYMNDNGKSKSKSFKEDHYLTSPTKMTLIEVGSFVFPTSNYYDNLWLMDELNDESDMNITTTLLVMTNVDNKEFNNNVMSRNFRVDKVILVPVQL